MRKMLNLIDKWLFESFNDIPAKGLSAFRVVFSFYFLIVGFRSYASNIRSISPVLYDPKRSFATFFELPSQTFFIGLDYLILILLILVLVGYRTKWTTLLLGFCFLIGNTFVFSFGKISHGGLLVMLTPIIFSFSNWGAYYSLDSKYGFSKQVNSWPIALFALLFSIAMLSAGLEKLYHGWLEFDYEKVRHVFYRGLIYEKHGVLTELILSIQSKVFWKVADYSVVIFEVGFILVVWRSNLFRFWIALAIVFHLSIYLFMDVTFLLNLVCYVVFINWAFILDKLRMDRFLEMIFVKIRLWYVGLLVVLFVFLKWQYRTAYLFKHLKFDKDNFTYSIFGLAIILTLGSIFYYLKNRRIENRS